MPMEAGFLGLPVVATDISGVDEIICDGETGILIPKHCPVLYAEAINKLLDNPQLAQRMGAKARQRIDELFLRMNNSKAFIQVYNSLI